MDNPHLVEVIRKALQHIINMSELPEESIFKICVEFWFFLTDFIKKNSKQTKLFKYFYKIWLF